MDPHDSETGVPTEMIQSVRVDILSWKFELKITGLNFSTLDFKNNVMISSFQKWRLICYSIKDYLGHTSLSFTL